ncbi:hypothetical protein Trydic_g9402 [Trypoxylus dichotomus]
MHPLEGKTAPDRKPEKQRLTFLACNNASRTHKVKPLVIGKAKNLRAFKSLSLPVNLDDGVNLVEKTGIDKSIFQSYITPSGVGIGLDPVPPHLPLTISSTDTTLLRNLQDRLGVDGQNEDEQSNFHLGTWNERSLNNPGAHQALLDGQQKRQGGAWNEKLVKDREAWKRIL